ncbi:CRISPR-associated helicase, Cas3 family [Streptoalloteichus tenebrarius]|uniref:CRISPR-associated helicase, Cas3 family n=1 Tax=Streptoalloteichus tenebrarius (strain ATCC 17920 / DSM 40477 / JCM 4838 / CBS 697.72 / NBRC 16177 / NCIMB 11028 / NRRL B-12390 / A12253. 1 / ISP 5477) TaxID=1933 RepID=Q2MF35_STRSD|nr:CRISPR-associated helicase Cas3' [Streptoalloteichus tenebrarius]MCP2261238.1 CRISPR-associated helicase, Cas3 family [Streptoalloteichus tenebrarius]BFF04429.1 CRISPR-associated helicase Cas3' [Streptoalloteichus tenebrarius]CAH18536.1 putative helicase [Streptoalloteichus tenebrarius]
MWFGDDPQIVRWLGVLWGKSREKAGGVTNLLMSHLLDTASVGEVIWDHYLAPATRDLLDEVAGGTGRGRLLFAWLCGIHDCGKATPAHQRLWLEGAQAVNRAGLSWNEPMVARFRWRHDRAGGFLLRRALREAGWHADQVAWVWPLVAGHHGLFPSEGQLQEPRQARGELAGHSDWRRAQAAVIEVFTRELGFADLTSVQPVLAPSRATQLHLSGLVVMADWIASDEGHFKGVDDLARVSIEASRERARRAWAELGLRGGWGSRPEPGPEAFEERFAQSPRPSQRLVIEAARTMAEPGIMVVEAPMGEGKTKAALLASESLAARFGADGVFVGMPTQATSDPIFTQVRQWLGCIDPELSAQVALLHGKRMFNKEWRRLLEPSPDGTQERFGGVDEFGMADEDDAYGLSSSDSRRRERQTPAEWFLGAKRGLLCPFVVGTIDQLLMAATRTKHVMLRMAGLAGKVVVLDEVHAADVYMSRFLVEGLRWLGQARVPVVLLSATLPPQQRQRLIEAYLAGAASREEFALDAPIRAAGYPCVTTAWFDTNRQTPVVTTNETSSWRPDLQVEVEVLAEPIPDRRASREKRRQAQHAADVAVAELLRERLSQGGCALVIRNTVARAQSIYELLRQPAWFGKDVTLLHARLAAQERADRTERCLKLLGARHDNEGEENVQRPRRFVLVATQLAEQSFDVDADLLVTDLTTIDLLLQRIGRLHRHEKVVRPAGVDRPRVVVTGFDPGVGEAPDILGASQMIYGRYLMMRSAAAVLQVAELTTDDDAKPGNIWAVPSQVPELVARVYEPTCEMVPAEWREAERVAREEWEQRQRARAEQADMYLLTRLGEHEERTLAGLHFAGPSSVGTERAMEAVVRDGEPSVEVILVVRDGERYRTLAGRPLTHNGDVAPDLLDEVLGATVRLPSKFTDLALEQLRPLAGWYGHPWLRHSLALVLDQAGRAEVDGRPFCLPNGTTLRYDKELGLVEEASTAGR